MNIEYIAKDQRELNRYRKRLHRQIEIRRKVSFFFLSIFIIILFTFGLTNITTHANEEISNITYKYFKYYEIQKGDTLWELAKENIDYNYYKDIPSYIDEIVEINNISDDSIIAGQVIVVPYSSNKYK